MHKTISITIGGALFHVEDDAYATLEQYLASIRAHFAADPDRDEILSDIESRIAEQFSEFLGKSRRAVTLADVQKVIATMGTVKDFEEAEEGTHAHHASGGSSAGAGSRKLYRDVERRVIGGVCAGLGSFFNVDPVLVRLVFILSLFAGGFGVLLYIILWIVMPAATTATEQLEMTGTPVNLSTIEKHVRAGVDTATAAVRKRRGVLTRSVNLIGRVLRRIVDAISTILRWVFPVLARVIGVLLLLAMLAAIFFLTLVFLVLLFTGGAAYMEVPLYEFIAPPASTLVLAGGYFAIVVPLIFLAVLSASLVRMRNMFTLPMTGGLLGLWMIGLMTAGATAATVAPDVQARIEEYGRTHWTTMNTELQLGNFNSVAAFGGLELEIRQGATQSVMAEGSEEALKSLHAEISDGNLVLQGAKGGRVCLFCRRPRVRVIVTAPRIDSLMLNDNTFARLTDLTGQTLTLDLHGNSYVDGSVTVPQLNATLGGSSGLELSGTGRLLVLDLGGSSHARTSEFGVENARITLSGSSYAELKASKNIDGALSGGSYLRYQGNPTVNVETSGSSHVERDEPERYEEEYEDGAY